MSGPKLPKRCGPWPLLLVHCCSFAVVLVGSGQHEECHSLWELQRSSEWMTDHTVDDSEILYQDNMDWNYQDLPEIWSVPLTLERVRDQVDSRDFQLPGSTWSHHFCWVPRCLNWWQRPTSQDFPALFGFFQLDDYQPPSHLQPHCW